MAKEISAYEDLTGVNKGESIRLSFFYEKNNNYKGPKTEEGVFTGKFNSGDDFYLVLSDVKNSEHSDTTSFVRSHLYEVKENRILRFSKSIDGVCERREVEERLLSDFRYFRKNTPDK